jgi:hypothetical protein
MNFQALKFSDSLLWGHFVVAVLIRITISKILESLNLYVSAG